ncbi:MAG: glycosyltransferase family 39 protein [Lentimicrobiaceae bacterium]|nr:glycosyltransferase family 39 protein [Lentimicrobiaceae bacterium]
MRKHSIILLFIIGLGIFLRLYGIWNFSFMHDELSVISRLHFDTFSDLIEKGIKIDGHPAGIQVFLWLWTKIFGISEISLRLPFMIMGIACIPLMYVLTKKWFNAAAGLFTAGFVAVSQYTILYSLIARPYVAGLFFILLLLIVWTKMVFERDYRWKNVVLFGVFAASCAYIHHFSMLTAFLIALAGLLFVRKDSFLKYLLACLLAVILYVPHIPVLLHQISLGGIGGPDGWLDPPKPRFTLYYIEYLFHFSWIAALVSAIALMLSSKINKEQWNSNKIKIATALLLFVSPFAIGYTYSLYVNPVLQYSVLIFSFPFLLLAVASFIGSAINNKKIISLFLLLAAMTYSLVFPREHYKLLSLQWYEKSVSKSVEWIKKHGKNNVDCLLNMAIPFLAYYEGENEICIDNLLYSNSPCGDFSFLQKVESLQSQYLVAAGLTDVQIEVIKQFYPVLLEYIPCFSSEIYVFAKSETSDEKKIEGMPVINTEEYSWDAPIPAEEEFIPLKECNLSEICPSRFTKILLTLDYVCNDHTADYALVLETSYKGTIADWRCVKPNEFFIENGDTCRAFLPFRYELLVKDSKRIANYSVKIFLWNFDKTASINPVKCCISTYKDNSYIYGLVENLR